MSIAPTLLVTVALSTYSYSLGDPLATFRCGGNVLRRGGLGFLMRGGVFMYGGGIHVWGGEGHGSGGVQLVCINVFSNLAQSRCNA